MRKVDVVGQAVVNSTGLFITTKYSNMCEYDHHDHDGWYETGEMAPDVDYRLCDCYTKETDENGDSIWITCGVCKILQEPSIVGTFPEEVEYIESAIARIAGARTTEVRLNITRALLHYFVKEAVDLLELSLTCRELVRAKCDELEAGPLGSILVEEIKAARMASTR